MAPQLLKIIRAPVQAIANLFTGGKHNNTSTTTKPASTGQTILSVPTAEPSINTDADMVMILSELPSISVMSIFGTETLSTPIIVPTSEQKMPMVPAATTTTTTSYSTVLQSLPTSTKSVIFVTQTSGKMAINKLGVIPAMEPNSRSTTSFSSILTSLAPTPKPTQPDTTKTKNEIMTTETTRTNGGVMGGASSISTTITTYSILLSSASSTTLTANKSSEETSRTTTSESVPSNSRPTSTAYNANDPKQYQNILKSNVVSSDKYFSDSTVVMASKNNSNVILISGIIVLVFMLICLGIAFIVRQRRQSAIMSNTNRNMNENDIEAPTKKQYEMFERSYFNQQQRISYEKSDRFRQTYTKPESKLPSWSMIDCPINKNRNISQNHQSIDSLTSSEPRSSSQPSPGSFFQYYLNNEDGESISFDDEYTAVDIRNTEPFNSFQLNSDYDKSMSTISSDTSIDRITLALKTVEKGFNTGTRSFITHSLYSNNDSVNSE